MNWNKKLGTTRNYNLRTVKIKYRLFTNNFKICYILNAFWGM